MKNNGDIIEFLKKKEYVMLNNNLGEGSFGKTVLLNDPFIDEVFVAKNTNQTLIVKMKRNVFSKVFLMKLKLCISLIIIIS